ncbi:RNA-dependent ATPase rok1 [Xylographa bjoerkii]|nr:RNA-dependent ATPase rok1 [Xylographa bjoerkii]
MDILKLLSRSTNLQKSLSSKNSKNLTIPSAGASSSPQIFNENQEFHVHSSGTGDEINPEQGKKRKRENSGQVQKQSLVRPETLDFFREPGKENDGQPSTLNFTPLTSNADQGYRNDDLRISRLSEEECRRIFKSHKIKVTLLKKHENSVSKDKKHKKARSGVAISEKDLIIPVYSQPLRSFAELRTQYGVSKRLAANLDSQGYRTPTNVQLASLPLLIGSIEDRGLSGSSHDHRDCKDVVDLLTVAPTGSGKTLAFLIPVLCGLLRDRQIDKQNRITPPGQSHTSAIIIAPTHELADQIVNEGKKLAIGTGLKIAAMRKGMQLDFKLSTLDDESRIISDVEQNKDSETHEHVVRADVLVTTPLVLVHALSASPNLKPKILPSIRYLVLDEADVLLDPLFRAQTLDIWRSCTNEYLQTSLWSATIGSSIESLAQSFISERRQELGQSHSHHYLLRLIIGLKDSALPTISHRLIYAGTEQGKLLAIRQLLHPATSVMSEESQALRPPFLVFTQTISRAVALHSELLYDIPPEAGGSARIAVLHSDLSDTARSNIMAEFRKGEIWVLITTDLLSRGIDFRGINGVVSYDIPNTGAAYIHRAGRTGRAGREGGIAVTLYTKEDIPYVKNVANVIAASQKMKGKSVDAKGSGIQKWLLDALPDVSKKSKQELKRGGVEARRTAKDEAGGKKEARMMRISTKSGFDRRLENNRKGAIKGAQRRVLSGGRQHAGDGSDDEWGGIEA